MECTVFVSAMMKLTLLPGGMTSRERVPLVILKIVSLRALLNQLPGSSEITKVTEAGILACIAENGAVGRSPCNAVARSLLRTVGGINPETSVHARLHVGKQVAMVLPVPRAYACSRFNGKSMAIGTVGQQSDINGAVGSLLEPAVRMQVEGMARSC